MNLPIRKRNRLTAYDYGTPGAYFVTICTKDRKNLLGKIVDGNLYQAPQIRLSAIGKIVAKEITRIESHYTNVKTDAFVIMPNHVHLILRITERINPFPTKKCDIPNIVGKLKAAVTRNVGKAFMPSASYMLWQSSFHDRIIRNEAEYRKIWQYIETNPEKWQSDCFYTADF